MTVKNIKCDIAIVGGGLAGGLIALALAKMRPELNLVLIEQGKSFGGNHIWSYFASDILPEHRWLTAPLVTYGWSGYDVKFPAHSRSLDTFTTVSNLSALIRYCARNFLHPPSCSAAK